jgi:hypothetical protein
MLAFAHALHITFFFHHISLLTAPIPSYAAAVPMYPLSLCHRHSLLARLQPLNATISVLPSTTCCTCLTFNVLTCARSTSSALRTGTLIVWHMPRYCLAHAILQPLTPSWCSNDCHEHDFSGTLRSPFEWVANATFAGAIKHHEVGLVFHSLPPLTTVILDDSISRQAASAVVHNHTFTSLYTLR